MRLHRAEAAALAAFAAEAGDFAWAASAERLIELGNRLRGRRAPDAITPPRSFKAKLRPYQSEGLAWLEFLRDTGFGGVLADDMGLGKTIQTLAHSSPREGGRPARRACAHRVARPALVPNWQAEAERFAPELSGAGAARVGAQALFAAIGEARPRPDDLSAAAARRRDAARAGVAHAAILDEAQAIKNPKATVTAHRRAASTRVTGSASPARRWRTIWASCGRSSLPHAGPARRRRALSAGSSARRSRSRATRQRQAPARSRAEALPPAADQGGGGARAAAQDRDPASGSSWTGRSATSTRRSALAHARAGARGDRRQGLRAQPHHRPRRAAEAAPGLLRSAPREAAAGAARSGLGQARTADGDAAASWSRRAGASCCSRSSPACST